MNPTREPADLCMAKPSSGFTLLEITLVLGLLAAFCVFLLQLLTSGVQLFDEGESGQDLADRAHAAGAAAQDAIGAVVGPRSESSPGEPPTARLLVQRVPFAFVPGAPPVQVVRSSVQLGEEEEQQLLGRQLLREHAREWRGLSPSEIEQRLADALQDAPRTRRGEMLLLPWPQGDPDGAYLELRRGLFLPGERVEVRQNREVGVMEPRELGGEEFPAQLIPQWTVPIASSLLHCEFALWSQYTRDWAASVPDGPETLWDSARAGWLSGGDDPRARFSLDLSAQSLLIPSDDVWPRYVRITLVVDRSPDQRPDAVLGRDLGPNDQEIPLLATDRLPPVDEVPLLKLGGEWIRYRDLAGSALRGVTRGQRGTRAEGHRAGTRLRAGKTIVLLVPIACGRDCWNG